MYQIKLVIIYAMLWRCYDMKVVIIGDYLSPHAAVRTKDRAHELNLRTLPFSPRTAEELYTSLNELPDPGEMVYFINNDNIILNGNYNLPKNDTVYTVSMESCSHDECLGMNVSPALLVSSVNALKLALDKHGDKQLSDWWLQYHTKQHGTVISSSNAFNLQDHYTAGAKVDVVVKQGSYNQIRINDNEPAFIYHSTKDTEILFHQVSRALVSNKRCRACSDLVTNQSPSLFLALHIKDEIPFLSNVLEAVEKLNYNKPNVELAVVDLKGKASNWEPKGFKSYRYITKEIGEDGIEQDLLSIFLDESKADTYLYMDSSVYLYPDTISKLVAYNLPVISPFLTFYNGTAWSNMWGDFDENWNYKPSPDYDAIFLSDTVAQSQVYQVYRVACARNILVMSRDVLESVSRDLYSHHVIPEVSLCKSLHQHRIPIFSVKDSNLGWIIHPRESKETGSDFTSRDLHLKDWMVKYVDGAVNEEPLEYLKGFKEVCKHVYHQKTFRKAFTDHLLALAKAGRRYSDGYFEVPVYDISSESYSATLSLSIGNITSEIIHHFFPNYKSQQELFDINLIKVPANHEHNNYSSARHLGAYNVIVPLNKSKKDPVQYKFVRQNCTVFDYEVGDVLLYPGRVTHHKLDLPSSSQTHFYLHLSFDPPRK